MGTPTCACHTILQGKSIWDRRPYNKKGINLFFLPWLPREQLHFNRPGMPCINWHVAYPRTSEITAKNLSKNLSDTEHQRNQNSPRSKAQQHKVRKRRFNARLGRQRDSKDSVGASFVHIRPRVTDRIVRGEKKNTNLLSRITTRKFCIIADPVYSENVNFWEEASKKGSRRRRGPSYSDK